jgi:hypothetical protein
MASIPVCDMECQKQKQLDSLLTSMKASENNPEAYEQARIKYYTLKEGQGWLAQEKERLAKKEIEPVLKSLDEKYESLKSKLNQKTVGRNVSNEIEESMYMRHQLMKETDKVGVAQRLSQFSPAPTNSSMVPILLDITIACLCLFIGYSLIKRVRG